MWLVTLIGELAWPTVVVWALWYFQTPIKVALARMKEFGPSGVKLGDAPADQVALPPPASSTNSFILEVKQRISPDQLEGTIAAMKTDLVAKAGDNKEQQIDVLLHVAAALNIQLAHERNYRVIFGSQIDALDRMNEMGGATADTIKAIYSTAAASFPDAYKTYPFESWIKFLTDSGLVTSTGDTYQLTAWGRGLLRYILDNRLPTAKSY